MQIWEVLDSQVKRADAKIKQLDRAKNREETGSDSESSKGFSAELRRNALVEDALPLCPVLAKSGH